MDDTKHEGAVEIASTAKLCEVCYGDRYEMLGCCGGHDCGCMGLPVDAKPCPKCNPEGKLPPSGNAKKTWPWFFMTKAELEQRKRENQST